MILSLANISHSIVILNAMAISEPVFEIAFSSKFTYKPEIVTKRNKVRQSKLGAN